VTLLPSGLPDLLDACGLLCLLIVVSSVLRLMGVEMRLLFLGGMVVDSGGEF
tara:strand:+ start:10287 stop:10442 length:156 start_codon:yes stop_codon:yes gene_type:complete